MIGTYIPEVVVRLFAIWVFVFIAFGMDQARADPPRRLRALYGSLDPTSISQHLALYQLYPNTPEGKAALQRAHQLLSPRTDSLTTLPSFTLPAGAIQAIVALVNKHPQGTSTLLSEEQLQLVDRLASHLPNRRLKGFRAASEEEVLALAPHEIDLARGLFLSQLGNSPEAMASIRNYEAMLDLMTLQIRARLAPGATEEEKVRQINRFVFDEMNYRFPPHSLYAKEVDLYTFLPSVLDTRRGVCLGVSVLYLCIAQRLDLQLEIVTPPGHIYVRYHGPTKEINIETTMRGVHVDSEEYLGIDTIKLQRRNLKDTIGMTHFNQAGTYLQAGEFAKAVQQYEKAAKYVPDDQLVKELMGYALVFSGREREGRQLLAQVKDWLPEEAVSPNIMVSDYLDGRADAEGFRCLFMSVDENTESLQTKRNALQEAVKRCPQFRSGWLQLATTLLQMNRYGEALESLKTFHALCPTHVSAEYFLAVVHAERLDYNNAWRHVHTVEELVAARNHYPKSLKSLRRQLAQRAPEVTHSDNLYEET